jgi:segregation and condensation protein A
VEVSTPVFEGPFDLLLHLILKEQVDLYEVELSRIVDAYLTELERMQNLDLDIATEFLLIASTLVELKARRLLPGREDVDLDEELALWEERDELLARLLECKMFKDAGGLLGQIAAAADLSFPRLAGLDDRFVGLAPDMLEGVTPDRLRAASVRVSVADALAELVDELPRSRRIGFRRLTSGLTERLDVIVRFLALLEMYKQGWIELDQPEYGAGRFGDIEITWLGTDGNLALATVDDYEG